MKLFNRNQNNNVPADLEAYAADQNDWRAWVRRIVVIVILVAIIAAVIWAGIKVHQNVTRDEPVNKPIDQTVKEEKKADEAETAPSQPTKPTQNTQAPAASDTQTTPTMPKTGDDTTSQPAVLPSTGG